MNISALRRLTNTYLAGSSKTNVKISNKIKYAEDYQTYQYNVTNIHSFHRPSELIGIIIPNINNTLPTSLHILVNDEEVWTFDYDFLLQVCQIINIGVGDIVDDNGYNSYDQMLLFPPRFLYPYCDRNIVGFGAEYDLGIHFIYQDCSPNETFKFLYNTHIDVTYSQLYTNDLPNVQFDEDVNPFDQDTIKMLTNNNYASYELFDSTQDAVMNLEDIEIITGFQIGPVDEDTIVTIDGTQYEIKANMLTYISTKDSRSEWNEPSILKQFKLSNKSEVRITFNRPVVTSIHIISHKLLVFDPKSGSTKAFL